MFGKHIVGFLICGSNVFSSSSDWLGFLIVFHFSLSIVISGIFHVQLFFFLVPFYIRFYRSILCSFVPLLSLFCYAKMYHIHITMFVG